MTPDPTASLDAEQARQRVLALQSSSAKFGYYGDVVDVCRIALEAMDERDDARRENSLERARSDDLRAKLAAQQPHASDAEIEAWRSMWQRRVEVGLEMGEDGELLEQCMEMIRRRSGSDDSLRKAAQAFVDEPYQTDSARFHGLRNDLRAALAAAPAPRQDDALRELRAWLVWGADISEKHRSYSAKINPVDVLAKIDELLAAKPAPAAPPASPALVAAAEAALPYLAWWEESEAGTVTKANVSCVRDKLRAALEAERRKL